MNWKRGLGRHWFVLSMGWITYVIWREWTFIEVVMNDAVDFSSGLTDLRDQLVSALIPPILGLLIGYSIYWSAQGFKEKQEASNGKDD